MRNTASRSRTHDQMIQAARSGRQNIAEGSMDSGTSRKSEMKLTGIAKGSLVELKLDFEDFLRQRGLPMWPPDHPALQRLKAMRCSTLEGFRAWVADDVRRAAKEEKTTDGETQTHTDAHGHGQGSPRLMVSVLVSVSPCLPRIFLRCWLPMEY